MFIKREEATQLSTPRGISGRRTAGYAGRTPGRLQAGRRFPGVCSKGNAVANRASPLAATPGPAGPIAAPRAKCVLKQPFGGLPCRRISPFVARSRAFTLVELLLVVTIIGVLAALVVPKFAGRSQQARITAAKQDIVGTLGVALDLFEQDAGRYPTTEEGLQVLVTAPTQGDVSGWNGPYIKSATVPKDPWGRDYRYTYPSQLTGNASLYDLLSAGPDGQYGTADDISNHGIDTSGRAASR
jgi:general secretion pathway protein G